MIGLIKKDLYLIVRSFNLAYLLSYFLTAISGILMLVIGYTFSLVIPSLEERRHEILLYTIVCLCLCLLYNAVMIPATYKFGSVKGKVILLLFIALLPLIGILLMKGFNNISNSVIAGRSVVRFLVIIDLVLVELASYVLALKFRDGS